MRNIVEGLCARCYKPATSKCRCTERFYCTEKCQRKDWELGHKHSCGKPPQPVCTQTPPLPTSLIFDSTELPALMAAAGPSTPCGLVNLGHTCYMNSVLQCLVAVPGLRSTLASGSHRTSCTKSGFCAACDLEGLVEALQSSQDIGRVLQPTNLAANVAALNEDFRLGAKEDAHEFMSALLAALLSAYVPDEARVLREREKDTTAVHQLLQGVTASQTNCPKCDYTKANFEPFTEGGLSLEITMDTDSVREMLEAFTCPERLDKDNKLQCGGCGQMVRASKQLSMYRGPNLLCIHLKRFRLGFQGKINKKIAFEPLLELKHFMTPGSDDEDPQYELRAVLVHLDLYNISSFGHYIAFILSNDGKWYCCDDRKVSEVTQDQVLEQNAYMLFYQRRSPHLFTCGEGEDEPEVGAVGEGECVPAVPQECTNGCGFFGQEERKGMCTQCFRQKFPAEAAALEAELARVNEEKARDRKRAEIAAKVEHAKAAPATKVKANDPCPCGSGKKYKKCHGQK